MSLGVHASMRARARVLSLSLSLSAVHGATCCRRAGPRAAACEGSPVEAAAGSGEGAGA